jgi:DNA repair exonuclease SbcCD ATPase subunit
MIKQLDLINFGGHTARYIFGARKHLIKGKNEAGKSSISKAIAFGMMGVDTDGGKNPDHLVSIGFETMEVSLTTNKGTTFKRTKKLGATSKLKLIREGIPATDLNQTDLMNQVGLSLDLFMSCWLTGYFMKLPAASRLKVLGEIANINRKDLLQSLLPDGYAIPAQIKLINPKIDADAIAGLRRQEQNKRTAAEATLNTLVANQDASLGMTEEEYNRGLALLAEVTATIEQHDLYQRQAVAYNNEVEKRKDVEKRAKELISNVKKAQEELASLSERVEPIKQELEFVQKQKEDFRAQAANIEKDRAKIEISIPTKHSVSAGFCSTCQQPVNETHVAAINGAYEKAVNEYNEHSRKVADHNKKVDQSLEPLRQGYKDADARSTELTRELYQIEADQKALTGALDRLKVDFDKSTPKEMKPLTPPTPPDGDIVSLKNERDNLAAGTRAYQQILAKQGQDAKQIESLKESIHHLDNVIVRYSALEKTLLSLPEIETQKTLEKVLIPGVNLSLVESELIVKDSKGIDYRSLSDGRKMKIDILLATAIRRAAPTREDGSPRAPQLLFVDNADLMDSQLEIPDDVQVLIAHVDNSVDGVQVVEL